MGIVCIPEWLSTVAISVPDSGKEKEHRTRPAVLLIVTVTQLLGMFTTSETAKWNLFQVSMCPAQNGELAMTKAKKRISVRMKEQSVPCALDSWTPKGMSALT